MSKMKTLSKLKPEVGVWMEEKPVPSPGDGDVLIKIRKTAICGTDIHIYNWDDWAQSTVPLGLTFGHEFAGQVVGLGKNVTGIAVGDRVSGEGHLICGHCRNCRAGRRHLCRNSQGLGVNRPGSFAEYLVMPAGNVFPLPDCVSDDMAALFDPFGNATHTALQFDLVGEDVLITGAGPIGIMAAAVARHAGARYVVITDMNDYRLSLARRMGIDGALHIGREKIRDQMNKLGMTEGFDIGMEMSGSGEALQQMIGVMNNGGKMALLGIPAKGTGIDWNRVIFKMLTLKGIYGREIFETWYKMSSLLQSGLDLSPIITHQFPVARFEEAFQAMASGQTGKVILDWTTV